MQIFNVPETLPVPELMSFKGQWSNYDKALEKHQEDLKEFILEQGYKGDNSGDILTEPMGDGQAMYMLADKGSAQGSVLIHLPYGDAWDSPNIQYLPYKEVIRRIEARKGLIDLFKKHKK